MQINSERRTGADRRQIKLSSSATLGPERRWHEASLGSMAGNGDEIYDPYDPYWEPVSGQDDD